MKRRVADIIMTRLVERGITDCFAVVGGGAMYIDNALLHCGQMNKYFNHHEQACAMAAEAYARVSGRMALVSVTSGAGGTNTLTGVMGAWVDSIPLIVISGQVRYAVSVPKLGLKLRTRGVQEFNIVDTVRTMTKYAKLVVNPLDIRMEIDRAVDIAMSGRRGPVWLDIPQDVQSAMVEEADLTPSETVRESDYSFDGGFVLERLKKARRPVFLAGGGLVSIRGRDEFRNLAERFQVPSVTSFNGSDVTYRDGRFFFGPIGPCGQRAANIIVQNSDLIIAFGCSMGFSTTGFAQENFAPGAEIISVDVDDEEMKKPGLKYLRQYRCDAGRAIADLISAAGTAVTCAPEEWTEYCGKLKARFSPYEAAEGRDPGDRVCSYSFWKEFYAAAPDDAVLVLGNNSAITSALQIGNLRKEQHIFANHNCGSMGYDLPAAIGMAVAEKREIILATGDGSIMMNIQELQTIFHHNLPIKILIFENRGYNAIRQTSKNFFKGELIGCTPETGVSFPSFRAVADAFGIRYSVCRSNGEAAEKISEFMSARGPAIMEISQLLDDPVSPKVMSRTDENGRMVSPALHDMFPFIPKEELDSFMIGQKERRL